MAREYGAKGSGAVWPHTKINETQPDFRGHIDLSRAQLRELVELAKASNDQTFKILIGIWDRTSRNGEPYKYVGTEVLISENDESQQPRQQQATSPAAKKPWD